MHSRKPVFALVAIGAVVVAVLTYFPYSLTLVSQASRRVREAVGVTASQPATQPELVAAPPAPPAFDAALWFSSRGEEPEKQGVLIESFDGRQTFASHNADTTYNPASLIKLATTMLALRQLGPDFRFETRVYADGVIDPKTKQLQGSVYVVGDDPTFGDFAANLVAQELRARGVEQVRDRIVVSPQFSFNFNEKPDDSAKHAADVMRLKQKETGVEDQPKGGELFVLRSNPLREVLLYMNAHSNNFVADRIGARLGGPAAITQLLVGELKLPAEQVYLETNSGLYTNRMTPRGLLAVIRALDAEAKRHGLGLQDVMSIAYCDWGTLRRRMEGTGFECSVIGKTGTLTTTDGGMSNLAGVVLTQDAGPVLFAILVQGTRIWEHKQMADQLLTEVLAAHRPAPLAPPQTRRQLIPSAGLRVEPQMYHGKVEQVKDTRGEADADEEEGNKEKPAETKKGAAKKSAEKGKAKKAEPPPSKRAAKTTPSKRAAKPARRETKAGRRRR